MIQKTSIGLIGIGYLGKFHLQQIQKIQDFNLVGIHDINMNLATSLGKKYKVAVYDSVDKLINECDAVSIVVPTQFHYDIAIKALHKGCHIFIEKPITSTLQQAIGIVELAKQENRICQIGHIERFNSAFVEFEKLKIQPKSIKCQRLNHYTNRGTDVSVVLDLMIHDIDLITAINSSEIKSITALGEKKHSSTIDYAKADIVFNNGCQCSLISSRMSDKICRTMKVVASNFHINIDFINQTIVREGLPSSNINEKKVILVKSNNQLYDELHNFSESIQSKATPKVTAEMGAFSLDIAIQIEEKIYANLK